MQKQFRVPVAATKPQKDLRVLLKSLGFPLANNEERKAPDSVIRIKEGWRLVEWHDEGTERVYTMETVEYKEIVPNDL